MKATSKGVYFLIPLQMLVLDILKNELMYNLFMIQKIYGKSRSFKSYHFLGLHTLQKINENLQHAETHTEKETPR